MEKETMKSKVISNDGNTVILIADDGIPVSISRFDYGESRKQWLKNWPLGSEQQTVRYKI
jgi:hypothetical protein